MNKFAGLALSAVLLMSNIAVAAGGDTGRTDNGAVPAAVTSVQRLIPITTFSGNWSATTPTGTQTGRTNRNGIPSACDGATLTTPLFNSDALQSTQSAHTIANSFGQAACYTFTLTVDDPVNCGFNLQPNLYLGSFNPANPIENWIGTAGLSTGVPQTTVSFSARIPDGASAVYVLNNTNAIDPAAVACVYRVLVTADVNLPVPAMSDQWRTVLVLLLGVVGFFGYRRYASKA